MTIRQQIATLPEPYRTMAEKYEHNQGWENLPRTDWDESTIFSAAFDWGKTEEGMSFWDDVDDHLDSNINPLPPLP